MLRTKLTLSTLVATIVLAGCSTQMTQPTQKDVSATKVEAVKVSSNVVDLGEKNGSSVNVRVGLNNKSPFGIKATSIFDSTDFANTNGGRVVVRLHKYPNPHTKTDAHNPSVRFEDMLSAAYVTEFTMLKPGISPFPMPLNLTFRGLKSTFDYFVSARAFVDKTLSASQLQINDLSGAGDITLSGSSIDDAQSLYIEPGDEIQFDDDGAGPNPAKFYKVMTVTDPDHFKVNYTGTGFTSTPTDVMMFARNVTSIGDKGTDGTPANQGNGLATAKGGGTAGGDGATSDEEFVSVATNGSTTVSDFGAPNQTLDIKLQLRSTMVPNTPGVVAILPGQTDSSAESITSP